MRDDRSAAGLAEEQLQWVVGRNPFVQSTMYGEGRLFCSLYSAMSGEIAGALSVGMETRGDRDVPYWPASNFPTGNGSGRVRRNDAAGLIDEVVSFDR